MEWRRSIYGILILLNSLLLLTAFTLHQWYLVPFHFQAPLQVAVSRNETMSDPVPIGALQCQFHTFPKLSMDLKIILYPLPSPEKPSWRSYWKLWKIWRRLYQENSTLHLKMKDHQCWTFQVGTKTSESPLFHLQWNRSALQRLPQR